MRSPQPRVRRSLTVSRFLDSSDCTLSVVRQGRNTDLLTTAIPNLRPALDTSIGRFTNAIGLRSSSGDAKARPELEPHRLSEAGFGLVGVAGFESATTHTPSATNEVSHTASVSLTVGI